MIGFIGIKDGDARVVKESKLLQAIQRILVVFQKRCTESANILGWNSARFAQIGLGALNLLQTGKSLMAVRMGRKFVAALLNTLYQ